MRMINEIEDTEKHRVKLELLLQDFIKNIGAIPIGKPDQFPYGWRKAAKGRTVWRILEELISQNLEAHAQSLGLHDFRPADSEVGVYDFSFSFEDSKKIYVNIKSAVRGNRISKDDISKADKLITFLKTTADPTLFIVTIEIQFLADPMRIELTNCYVVPITWLPDIYVNPSNNGNLQSSKYKSLSAAIPRNHNEFLALLEAQLTVANKKRSKKVKDDSLPST